MLLFISDYYSYINIFYSHIVNNPSNQIENEINQKIEDKILEEENSDYEKTYLSFKKRRN